MSFAPGRGSKRLILQKIFLKRYSLALFRSFPVAEKTPEKIPEKTPKKTQDDILFDEIDDELRQDRAHKLWRAYGHYAVGAVLAIVISVAGYQGWQKYQLSSRLADGAKFAAAAGLADADKFDAAFKAFAELSDSGGEGYQLLARFNQARLLADRGEAGNAAIAYRVLADDPDVEPLYRGLAVVLGALQELNDAGTDWAALEKRLEPLMADSSPWRFSARELAGLLAKRSGDTTKAKKLFSGLAEDRIAPQGIRNRAREMLSILGK
jgi:hypothetical protein